MIAHGHRWIWLSVAAVAWLCVFALLGFRAFAQSSAPLRGQVVFPAGQRPAPDFMLQDQYGQPLSLHQLRGRVLVITFLDSHCTQQCPILGREMALVQRRLGPSIPWTLLVVSVAPLTDTPASSATFALESGWHGDWRWLFGTPAQLAPVWRAYGIWVQPAKAEILHTAVLYVVDTGGYERIADTLPLLPDDMVQSIQALAPQAQHGWLHWPSWL